MLGLVTHQHMLIFLNTHLPVFHTHWLMGDATQRHAIRWMSPPPTNHNQPYYHGQCKTCFWLKGSLWTSRCMAWSSWCSSKELTSLLPSSSLTGEKGFRWQWPWRSIISFLQFSSSWPDANESEPQWRQQWCGQSKLIMAHVHTFPFIYSTFTFFPLLLMEVIVATGWEGQSRLLYIQPQFPAPH